MERLSHEQANIAIVANKALTAIGYISYPTLLVLELIFDPALLPGDIIVPAAGFFAVTIVRRMFNAPRPYENGGDPPLIEKSTKGKSFPSRHTFCMFMIAYTWMQFQPIVATLLLICACFLAICRVRLGVHYPRDVIAAGLIATIFAAIGYLAIF